MGDGAENQGVVDDMGAALDALRESAFEGVHAATLREDWPEARAQAESAIREWVCSRSAGGIA